MSSAGFHLNPSFLDPFLDDLGRRGAVEGLALEKAGLGINSLGHIDVNEHYQTGVSHIYAAGDVIGFPALASTSMEQGRVAMCHAFGFPYKQRLASQLPMGIYTIPEISAVGETEESCRERKIEFAVGRAKYANNARGQIIGDLAGMLKLIFRRDERDFRQIRSRSCAAVEVHHISRFGRGHVDAEHSSIRHAVKANDRAAKIGNGNRHACRRVDGEPNRGACLVRRGNRVVYDLRNVRSG